MWSRSSVYSLLAADTSSQMTHRAVHARNFGHSATLVVHRRRDTAPVPLGLVLSILLDSRLTHRVPTRMIEAGVRAAMQIESVLGELADAKEAPLRRLVACDPETNPFVLLLLAEDSNPLVRRALARRPHMPGLLWFPLSNDPSPVVRRTLAAHPNVPPEILTLLAHDKAISVRLTVARHPRCPDTLLEELAQDQEPIIRLTVVARPDISTQLLERLGRSDHHRAVRRASLARLTQQRPTHPITKVPS
jgi:hypothetical protein